LHFWVGGEYASLKKMRLCFHWVYIVNLGLHLYARFLHISTFCTCQATPTMNRPNFTGIFHRVYVLWILGEESLTCTSYRKLQESMRFILVLSMFVKYLSVHVTLSIFKTRWATDCFLLVLASISCWAFLNQICYRLWVTPVPSLLVTWFFKFCLVNR